MKKLILLIGLIFTSSAMAQMGLSFSDDDLLLLFAAQSSVFVGSPSITLGRNGGNSGQILFIASDNDQLSFTMTTSDILSLTGGDFSLEATKRVYFDGSSKSTFIYESSDGVLSFVANNTAGARFKNGGFQQTSFQELTANSSGTALITDGTSRVAVISGSADDYLVLPAAQIGYEIWISNISGANVELRTPSASGATINDVDCSGGSVEYLITDTDLVVLRCDYNEAWVAVSYTKLGAVRTAVVPD